MTACLNPRRNDGWCEMATSCIGLGACARTDVHTEALVEGAGLDQNIAWRHTETRGAKLLGARPLCGLALGFHHLPHLRRELDHGPSAEDVIGRPHPGPNPLDDRLGRVVVKISVEVAAHAILAGLCGHLHLNVHVVAPLVHANVHAKGERHVHDALLVALWHDIGHVPLAIVVQTEALAREGAGEGRHHRLAIDGKPSTVASTHLDLVAVQEWTTHNNLVRRGQALGIPCTLEAALNVDCLTFYEPEVPVAVKAGSLALVGAHLIEGNDMRIA